MIRETPTLVEQPATKPVHEPPKVEVGPPWRLILRQVAKAYRTTCASIVSRQRDRNTVYARHEYAYRLRNELGLSWSRVAKRIGVADHTSAIWAAQRHADFLATGFRKDNFRNGSRTGFWTPDKVRHAQRLRDAGKSYREIAEIIGAVSPKAVSTRLLPREIERDRVRFPTPEFKPVDSVDTYANDPFLRALRRQIT